MNIFQKLYDGIKNWQAPAWLKMLLQQLNDLMFIVLKQVSEAYITYLKTAILEAAQHKDWSNDKKFDYVFDRAKKGLVEFSITLKDSEINAMINWLVLLLKKNGVIK